jgi:phosphate transport system substrate-binding protein
MRPKGTYILHLKRLTCLAAVALSASATAMTASATADTLQGAGSTLVAPLANEWAKGFQNATGNVVNYAAVGSGAGITDASNGIVDFGASDAPLSAAQAAACHGCLTIPWALSATGIGYNLPGLGNGVKLTGKILAQIYLGQITNWNSSAITKINKGVHLPNLRITPVFRSDGSGDTYAFTNYLSDINSTWRSQKGYATTVSFGAGVGAKGNSGVAAAVSNTAGAIGYISASYLIAQKIATAKIKNARGNYEYPGLSNIENAAATVHSVPAAGLHIVNPPRSQKKAYPISTFTNAIIPGSPGKVALLKSWLTYCVTTGRSFGIGIDFAPIPRVVQNAALADISRL